MPIGFHAKRNVVTFGGLFLRAIVLCGGWVALVYWRAVLALAVNNVNAFLLNAYRGCDPLWDCHDSTFIR